MRQEKFFDFVPNAQYSDRLVVNDSYLNINAIREPTSDATVHAKRQYASLERRRGIMILNLLAMVRA